MKHPCASLASLALIAFASPILAGPPANALRQSTACDWEAQFRQGTVDCEPVGTTRSTVLTADGRHPRMKARLQGMIWKGKTFPGDGTFTNRWVGGIAAGTATLHVETSWLDGRDSFVLSYPPDAPVFHNVRDELRQIAPNRWLGRSYDIQSGKLKNWFVLQGR